MVVQRTKDWVVKRLVAERRRLVNNLAALTDEDMLLPGTVGETSFKDMLAHLAHWESLMPGWVAAARRGEDFQTPAADLTWNQVHVFNQRIYEQHRDQPLEDVRKDFHSEHEAFMDMVEAMPEEEMLERGRYSFTGGSALFDWLNAYAAHDMWGKQKIRAWFKSKDEL